MKFDSKMGDRKILWPFPQQANVQQMSYETAI
jgi:hypothetical protein